MSILAPLLPEEGMDHRLRWWGGGRKEIGNIILSRIRTAPPLRAAVHPRLNQGGEHDYCSSHIIL